MKLLGNYKTIIFIIYLLYIMTHKILFLSIPKEGFAAAPGQDPIFTYKLPILSNDRVPNMEVELLEAFVSTKNQTLRQGINIKLMNTASNYLSQDNKGLHLGLLVPSISQDNYEIYTLTQNEIPFKYVMSSYQDEWVIQLIAPDGTLAPQSETQAANFTFRLTFPEPDEITNQYSREIAKVRL